MSKNNVQETSFDCKICATKVTFNISDPDSFISLSDEKKFAGMTLRTYRVGHQYNNEYHVNVVTVDHKGHWRAHVDAYVDFGDLARKEVLFRLSDSDTDILEPTDDFEFFAIADMNEGWVFDVISPPRFLPVEIAKDIIKNFRAMEDELIQSGILLNLDITIGLETFYCTKLYNKLIISILKNQDEVDYYNKFFEKLLSLDFSESKDLLNRESFKNIFGIMSVFGLDEKKIPLLIRIIQDGPKVNPINIQDFGTIPDLVAKVINQKSYPEHLIIGMISLLSGQNNLNELLDQGYLKNYVEIIDIIDFIRVKLLTDQHFDYPEQSGRVEKPVEVREPTEATITPTPEKEIDAETLFDDLPPLELEEKEEKPKSELVKPPKKVEKPNFEELLKTTTDEQKEKVGQPPDQTEIKPQPQTPVKKDPVAAKPEVKPQPQTPVQNDQVVATPHSPNPKLAEILERRKKQKTGSEKIKIKDVEKDPIKKDDDDLFADLGELELEEGKIQEEQEEEEDLFAELGELHLEEDPQKSKTSEYTDDEKSKLAKIANKRKKLRKQRDKKS